MNIFGVGGAELVLIVLIALVVAGPKRLIQWSYVLGKYIAKLRVMWSQVVDVVQKEIDEAGVDVQLPKDLPTRQSINQTISQAIKPMTESMEKAAREVREVQESVSSVPTMRVGEMLTAGKKLMETGKAPAPSSDGSAPSFSPTTTSPASANGNPTAAPTGVGFGAWGGANTSESSPPAVAPNRFGTWAQAPKSEE